MFRQLARQFQSGQQQAQDIFREHPLRLAQFLEDAWDARALTNFKGLSKLPDKIVQDGAMPTDVLTSLRWPPEVTYPLPRPPFPEFPRPGTDTVVSVAPLWDHLIYAYMIENTRVFEIMQRVLWEYAHGERLDTPSLESRLWLRATEELFYRDNPPFQIFTLTSYIRPDIRASRRNAYYRMFGMDLNHGTDGNAAYPYEKPPASNRDFVSVFEEFMREVWRGIENFANTSGTNSTDDAAIADLARRLSQMLLARRQLGNLSREEFLFVATMSWLHLTVEISSPIVRDLKADSTSPEERLRKIGERVGVPAHGKSMSYFQLAEPMSRILIALETGLYNDPGDVPALYAPGAVRDDMMTIVTHWSIATGRDIKAGKVIVSPRAVTPPAPAPAPAPDGRVTLPSPLPAS
jgi:hypothetical protein